MALKFGSKAWRAKYMKKGKRKNAAIKEGSKAWWERDRKRYLKELKKREQQERRAMAKRKNAAKRKPAKRKTAARRKRSTVRKNPPRTWTRVKAVRVVRKNGRDVLEIRK
jgi:hypothetical protein